MKFDEFVYGVAFEQKDFITQDKYLDFADSNRQWIQFVKTDALYHEFEWRGRFCSQFSPEKEIILFSHSDLSLPQHIANILQSDQRSIFAVNAECIASNVYGLPHGLTNDCDDTERHPILGNQKILCDVLSKEKAPKHLLYMNFNRTTDQHKPMRIRDALWQRFSLLPFVYKKDCTDKNVNLEDRKQYLQDLYDSKFALCPPGNGIDTVRMWEALYCRTIPIVFSDITLRYFEDLPILWVKSWEEAADPTYLDMMYEKIMSQEWNLEKLKIGYWTTMIETTYKENFANSH